jgi:RNA polymerase sigma-70 factor (ECF subfamily)
MMQDSKRFVGFENEKILIQALKNADNLAVEFWFKKYYSKLKKIALSKISNKQTAEEIVQETFINCLQSLNLFQGKSSLETWMQTVLRHEIADFYRKRYAKKFIKTLPLTDFLLDKNYKNAEETAVAVKRVLKKMAKKNRELLMVKYVDQKKVKEIARDAGRSEKAVESDLFRARSEFKKLWLEVACE